MATFIATTSSNGPIMKDADAARKILERYFFDGDLEARIDTTQPDGQPYLSICGYEWPGAFKIPEGVNMDDFEPDYEDDPSDVFEDLLKELAPFLDEPLTIQAIGAEKARFPLSACEWHVQPGDTKIEVLGFRHSDS